MTGLIVAIDTADLAHARSLVQAVAPVAGMVKLGLEFFAAHGKSGVATIAALGLPVFLDLKLHDIPNTVASAVAALDSSNAALLTVHASGGAAMVAAAVAATGTHASRTRILAVTVLTSLDSAALSDTGVAGGPLRQVVRLARLAAGAGADGIVCGPGEVAAVREAAGPDVILVVPGIRPAGWAADDQARAMTPADAARAGADWIVAGRPITRAENPASAARAIADELAAA